MIRIVVSALIVFGSAALASGQERPSEPPSEPPVLFEPVTVTAPPPFSASSGVLVPRHDFELRPQGRPGGDPAEEEVSIVMFGRF